MEGFRLEDMPKFSSPEEELQFLRAHVAREEAISKREGTDISREELTSETLRMYDKTPAKEILREAAILPEHEVEKIVLALAPEAHDRKMEELLSILSEKGIKNALSVVAASRDPHLDDDFHRFLVQYLHTMKVIPTLKEGTALFRSLNMKLFEVTLPPPADKEQKSFKDFVSAMEQFYAGMQSISDRGNEERNFYTIEIARPAGSAEVAVYVSIPTNRIDLFEKQVLGFYPDAKIREVTDDYNIFAERGAAAGAVGELSHLPIFPLKTYDTFDRDPMNALISVFSKLSVDSEGAAIQFTIVPRGDELTHQYVDVLRRMKDGEKSKDAYSELRGAVHHTGKVLKELLFGVKSAKNGDDKHVNEHELELVGNKIKSTIMTASIRVLAGASTPSRAEGILREVESAFNQFTEAGSNSLDFHLLDGSALRELFHNFSYRLWNPAEELAFNLKELATLFHFPVGVTGSPELKEAKSATAPVPTEMPMAMPENGIILGYNEYRGMKKPVYLSREDRMRHFYVIGQTGTGKTVFLKNMIQQDIQNGDGCCFIDPHGTDIQEILSYIPPERLDDVIYFDPAYTARPMGLNMLEYDPNYPEQKTFVVNELLAIFNKLFDMKVAGGPAFEQYFRNSALLVMEDPETGSTLLEIGRVLADKAFRDLKLTKCKNPIIKQFWENAEKTTGDQSLANFVPYITNKFDVFISNDIMRPVIAQQESVFNFRKIMDEKKILLVNLSKGRLGDINANLIGLLLVGKIQMAALSRVDMFGQKMNDFYLYIDEFQNVTTDSISSILSEARKYRLSLNIAHQYVEQLEEGIKNAVFGNVGSMAIHRISTENAEIFAKQLEPTFGAPDIIKLENLNCYIKMLVNGTPVKPFNSHTPFPPKGNMDAIEKVKELSYLKYGRDRETVEDEIMARYNAAK